MEMPTRKAIVLLTALAAAGCGEKSTSNKAKTTLPAVTAVEPNAGRPGTAVKIFGARLIGSDGLPGSIRFGDVVTAPTFADAGVYYTHVPEDVTEATHEVVVSTLDGISTAVTFTVTSPTPEELEERAWAECIPRHCTGDTTPNANYSACNATGDAVDVTVSLRDLLWETKLTFAHIIVADNTTGEPSGVCAVANTAGGATLRVPSGIDLAFRVVATNGPPVNTFHQRFTANASRVYYGLLETSMDAVASYGIDTQPGRSAVFGVVFSGPHEPYFTWDTYTFTDSTAWTRGGATTVAVDPASGTAVYTNASGYWDPTQTEIHPMVGDFIIYDVAPGPFSLAYFEDGVRTPVAYDEYRAFADELTLTFPVYAP